MNKRPDFSHFVLLPAILLICILPALLYGQDISQQQMEKDILHYVNQHREEIGKSPLSLLPAITKEAIEHSKNMARHKVPFGHDGFKERADNIRRSKSFQAMGENVAYGELDAEGVVKLWLKSGGHRRNIEGDFNYTGIGVAEAEDGTIYFTQLFILSNE
ncbi:MAG: hypothetical protein BGO69_11435 [Bacteroidetes bacterium 46-16]|nr:MAG: hypothetical protein BGO69_11435 [Bacteroidetes bacterium 46-16]